MRSTGYRNRYLGSTAISSCWQFYLMIQIETHRLIGSECRSHFQPAMRWQACSWRQSAIGGQGGKE